MKLKARAGTVIVRNPMMGKVIKEPFKTKNAFNFTMMASFLQVIMSKKEQTNRKNMYFIAVSHKFT